MTLYQEFKIKLVNKLIQQCLLLVFNTIHNECQIYIFNNEKSSFKTFTIQKSLQHMIEIGIIYHQINNDFLLIDDLFNMFFDLIVCI